MNAALPSRIGFGLICLVALFFIYFGGVGVVTNSVYLAKWQVYKESDLISAWSWPQLHLVNREIQISAGPALRRIVIVVSDVNPVCAIITGDGVPPRYVRRLPERDKDISQKLGIPVNVFEGVNNPSLHFLYHIFGLLIIFILGLFIFFVAGHNFKHANRSY